MISISRQNSTNRLGRDNSSKQKLIEIDTAPIIKMLNNL